MTLVPTRWWASFFMPSCLLLMGLAVGIVWCLWAWKRGRTPRQARVPIALTVGSASLLYLASTPWVARWAASTLERDHPPVAIESLPQADAIVVLAGAIAAQPRPDGSVHMFAGGVGDRFETGVAAFQAGRALYTSDEASNVAAELQKLGERGAKTIILCISAWHLPRAGARSGASTRWPRSGWGCPPGGDWLHRDSRDADTLTSNACARPSSTSSPARARTS